MAKTLIVQARIEPDLKRDAESVLKSVGLTPTQAISLFYRQIKLQQGLPFQVRIPNSVTMMAIEAVEHGEVEECESVYAILK